MGISSTRRKSLPIPMRDHRHHPPTQALLERVRFKVRRLIQLLLPLTTCLRPFPRPFTAEDQKEEADSADK